MNTSLNHNAGPYDTPADSVRKVHSGAPFCEFDRKVLRERGIDPDGAIALARGYRTVSADQARRYGFGGNSRPGLLIPIYNLAAEINGYMLRPHEPIIDQETGKSRKYLFVAGKTPPIGGTPAGTPKAEEWSHKLREDLNTPIIVTESMLKGDSILSHASCDVYTLAIHGTWNWVTNGAPSPELRDIPWRRKQGERVVQRRKVVLVPDSDYATKPEVARAWWEFGDSLRRKNADVRIYHLPTAADGSKLGPDDSLRQNIATVGQMIDESVPLPATMPSIVDLSTATDDRDAEIARLRADNVRQSALISALVQVSVSPDLNRAQAIPGIRALMEAHHKRSRGEVDRDGYATLSSREIANDWRTAEDKDAEYNPRDGSRPLMQCSRVKSQMEKLGESGAIDMRTREVKRPRPGAIPYTDTEYLVKVDDLPAALIQLAEYRKPERKKPTPTQPCKYCGEIHGKTIITICGTSDDPGCGVEIRKEVPVVIADAPEIIDIFTSSKFEEIGNEVVGGDSSAPLTNSLQTLKRRDSSGETSETLVPRCTWHLGGGETCDEPTEAWEFEGYGSQTKCHKHATKHRNAGSPPYREGAIA